LVGIEFTGPNVPGSHAHSSVILLNLSNQIRELDLQNIFQEQRDVGYTIVHSTDPGSGSFNLLPVANATRDLNILEGVILNSSSRQSSLPPYSMGHFYLKKFSSKPAPVDFAKLPDEYDNLEISLTPNPAGDFFNVSIAGATMPVELKLIDAQGKIVWHRSNLEKSNIHISAHNFEEGVYWLKVNDKNGQNGEAKIVIAR
jgi:hypothetical protein